MTDTFEDTISKLEATGQYRVLHKLQLKRSYATPAEGTKLYRGTMLDVETTGLYADEDEITNLALFQFTYDENGKIYNIVDFYDGFNETKKPIPLDVQKMTGITPAMIKGKKLDMAKIEKIFKSSEIIVAHNAGFDRAFVDLIVPSSNDAIWCCSQRGIPWDEIGADGAKLVTIAVRYGFFYDAHQARPDCLAGIEILSQTEGDRTILNYLLDTVKNDSYLVIAKDSPWEKKDKLARAKYKWMMGQTKVWWKLVKNADEASVEKKFLDTIYPQGRNTAVIEKFDRKQLYK